MNQNQDKTLLLQDKIKYHFSSPDLLLNSLTHSSYANEIDTSITHNERLEFLGDAVLELCISEEMFLRYPEAREGRLTSLRAKLVNESTLAMLARKIELQDFLLLGKGEENQGGRERDTILCDSLESLFGAIFLDGGYKEAKKIILRLYQDLWPDDILKPSKKDFKSRLQEITQKRFKDRPIYILKNSFGPEHAKTYQVQLVLPDGITYEAEATSVKKAEQMAARKAIRDFQSIQAL